MAEIHAKCHFSKFPERAISVIVVQIKGDSIRHFWEVLTNSSDAMRDIEQYYRKEYGAIERDFVMIEYEAQHPYQFTTGN
jgi:hypothetical protein